jgi:hypothetical protein
MYHLTICSAAGLVVFGVVYAVLVALQPLRPTWFEVVIGVAVTLIGASLMAFDLYRLGTWWAVGAFWAAFALTGGPMIVGQIIKANYFRREAADLIVREGNDCA